MRSTIAIEIAAPAALVFELARDVERWPRLLPHYVRVRALGRVGGRTTSAMVALRPVIPALGLGLPVAWRARTWAEPDTLRLHFQHVAGVTRSMEVTWRIDVIPSGCRVSIQHDFVRQVPLPLLGPMLGDDALPRLIDRLFVRAIAGRTLATFKAIAEATASAGARPPVAADGSDSAPPTYPRS